MTEQEAWMLACVIQASEEQHGRIVKHVEADSSGEWYVATRQLHRLSEPRWDSFHSPREWYETMTGE